LTLPTSALTSRGISTDHPGRFTSESRTTLHNPVMEELPKITG
jgi:hypothetical protein